MDVIFEPQRGRPFSIEVGFFDTVQEIKQKIQKYQGIPISRQTLVFKSQVLQDDRDVDHCEILQNSHIQLIVDQDGSNNEIPSPSQPLPASRKIKINVKCPSNSSSFALEVEPTETVARLKEKIHETESVPIGSFTLHANGAELHEHLPIGECENVLENSEIEFTMVVKNNYFSTTTTPPATATTANTIPTTAATTTTITIPTTATATTANTTPTATPNTTPTATTTTTNNTMANPNNMNPNNMRIPTNKLRVMVLTKCGTKKIPVEVNPGDSVGELRKELQRLQQRMNFHLPSEGYFFIYRQNVMDEDRSYRWHHVGQGDTIEVFNGSVTGGS